MSTLFLCGAGNSEGVRLAMILQREQGRWDRIVLLDDDPEIIGKDRIGVPIVGPFDDLANADAGADQVVNLVARTTRGRWKARERIASFGIPFAQLLHPNVDIFGADLADDVIVYHNATIGPEVVLGQGCVVFMGAVVGHECVADAGCVMAANSVLNARVQLGKRVYIGTNSATIPEIEIGDDATVAAGSVVVRHVGAGETAMGVPAENLSPHAPAEPAAIPRARRAGKTTTDPAVKAAIVTIWCEVLKKPEIDDNASFFEIGGDSLKALMMREQVKAVLGADLGVTDVFKYPTARSLAAYVSAMGVEAPAGAEPASDRASKRANAMRRRRGRT